MKLDSKKKYYEQQYGWVAHENGGGDPGSDYLIENRYNLEIIGGVEDQDASYSYDDWALIKLDKKYYMLSTSGCSCPSPTETWRIEKGPASLKEIKKHILNGDYEGYTMPKKQEDDFIKLLEEAEKYED